MDAFDEILRRTLDDGKLTRGERSALRQVLDDAAPNAREMQLLRSRVFAVASERWSDRDSERLLQWVRDVVSLLAAEEAPRSMPSQVLFSPKEDCWVRIVELLSEARKTIDICVFTITDDRISREIEDAHRRRIAVRIIADDDKSEDRGSDIERLRSRGIPLVMDSTPDHMHHKFAIFDGRRALTGSYNWTRSAASSNHENILVTDEPGVIQAYQREFDSLWAAFSG